jgi:hypothetical protein
MVTNESAHQQESLKRIKLTASLEKQNNNHFPRFLLAAAIFLNRIKQSKDKFFQTQSRRSRDKGNRKSHTFLTDFAVVFHLGLGVALSLKLLNLRDVQLNGGVNNESFKA